MAFKRVLIAVDTSAIAAHAADVGIELARSLKADTAFVHVIDQALLVGTESGLWQLRSDALEPVDQLSARTVTALAQTGPETWAIVDGRMLWHSAGGRRGGSLHGRVAGGLQGTGL